MIPNLYPIFLTGESCVPILRTLSLQGEVRPWNPGGPAGRGEKQLKKRTILILMVCALAAIAPVMADNHEEKPTLIAMSHDVMPQAGHELAFEGSLKKHWALHKKAGDPQAWNTWVQLTGKKTGTYSIRATFSGWEGLDHDPGVEGDIEDVMNNMMPHAKHNITRVTKWDLNLSNWPESIGTPNMVELTVFHLKPGMEEGFFHALGVISEFLKGNDDIPWNWAWGIGVSGHDGGTAILAIPHDNWASFADDGINMWKMLEEARGRIQTDALMEAITSAIKWQENYAVMHRPDLSYVPAE